MDITTAHPSSVFNFATEQGRAIVHLHLFVLVICVIIGLIVMSVLIIVAIKFRHRPGAAEPYQHHGNFKMEITWTVIPTFIVAVMAVLTAIVMDFVNPPLGTRQPDVIVNAHQWWWEYRYPKSGVVTANELYLPKGVNTLLEVRAADVVHSFWVPNFGQKMDAVPGHPNHLFLKPMQEGLFLGTCSEYCGAQHSLMRILATVVNPKEFEVWTQSQLKVPGAPTDKAAQHGEELFMSKTCIQCHSIAGTKARAQVAPDLTHLSSRKTIGSGVIANNIENATRWIMNAQQFKPGCYMPNMHMSQADAHDIAVYLESLK